MARILITEPHRERQLSLKLWVEGLGHEPIVELEPMHFLGYAAYIVNTDGELGATRVQIARHAAGAARIFLPVIGIGTEPPPEALTELDIEQDEWLFIPFTAAQLRRAIERVLAKAAVKESWLDPRGPNE